VIGGGIINMASNWSNINNFAEGLNYFTTGAVGYGVATFNPALGAGILASGNLLTKGIYGDLPEINSIGDIAGIVTSTALDFAGAYGTGTLVKGYTVFNAGSYLTNAEINALGVDVSTRAAGGIGIRSVTTKQVIQSTTTQAATQILKASSSKLAANLIKAGIQRPFNSAAHHIVAGGSTNRYAQLSRNILQRAGVRIDDAANGVFLPKNLSLPNPPASIHSTLHTNSYYENVYNRLVRVPLSEVNKQLAIIRNQLLQGTFPY
jgi:hypothetical protein